MPVVSTKQDALCFSYLLQCNKPPETWWLKTTAVLFTITILQDAWPQLGDSSALSDVDWHLSHLGLDEAGTSKSLSI